MFTETVVRIYRVPAAFTKLVFIFSSLMVVSTKLESFLYEEHFYSQLAVANKCPGLPTKTQKQIDCHAGFQTSSSTAWTSTSVTFNFQSGTNKKNMKMNKSPLKPLTPLLVLALHNIQHRLNTFIICKDANSQHAGWWKKAGVRYHVLFFRSHQGADVFGALVTGINVEAAASNSSCLLAVCPVSWPGLA